MQKSPNGQQWPPIPGDFEVGDPSSCVAVCTLGKKIDVHANYAIIGTCKTENIGIERVIINVISNPAIRFFILAGPEIPGHQTGKSLSSLYSNGVDKETRKIIDSPGAIPYIENVPLEGVERFREQVEFIDMMNNSNSEEIAQRVNDYLSRNPGVYPDGALWMELSHGKTKPPTQTSLGGSISVLPEFGLFYDATTSMLTKQDSNGHVSRHPSEIVIEMRETQDGTILVGKEK
ncbi:MAG: tetrahydromethanopterin S-methyltransferase subunit A [Candidatus Thorarchaeota archaeon]